MRPHPLRKSPSFWKQNLAALVLVAIYIGLTLLVVLAWNYLSGKADAFVSDAKRINNEELAHFAPFEQPPVRRAARSSILTHLQ